jgi:hypothetical protein
MMAENKALQKLEAMPLANRIAAVATDVDSKQDEFRSIDAHELASLLGIEDAARPIRNGDWNFELHVLRWPVDDILSYEDEEYIVEVLQSQLTPERYKELCSKIDLREEYKTNLLEFLTNDDLLEFLTNDEKQSIEEHNMEWRHERDGDSVCHCYAYNSIEAPRGKVLTFQALIEDDGTCITLLTPYDERDGEFDDGLEIF